MFKDDLITEFGSMPRRRHAEDDLQKAVFTFFKWALPRNAKAWHPPNGGKRSAREAARLAGLGVWAGCPDIHIAYNSRLYCIELKAPRGVLSPTQLQAIERLGECGVPTVTARSVEDVEAILKRWGIPISGRLS